MKTAQKGILCAVAIIFSYVEFLIPIPVPIPAFKLGLSNIAILFCLYKFSFADTLLISIARCFIVSLLFSGMNALPFALAGGILSLLIMWGIKKSDKFSIFGISVAGAVSHNLGQLAVAMLYIGNMSIISYLPFLMLCAVISGILIALITREVLKRLK